MKKRYGKIVIVSFVLIIAIVFLIYNKFTDGQPEEYSVSNAYSFMFESYLPDGILFFDGNYLRFANAQTGISTIICDDVSCMHEVAKESECGAVFCDTLGMSGMTIRGDKIIYILSDEGIGKQAVYRCDFNGKNRKKIAELPYMETVYMVSYYEDTAYIGYMNKLANNLENFVETQTGIYAINLNSGEGKDVFKTKAYQAGISALFADEKYVSFSYSYVAAEASDILEHGDDRDYIKKRSVEKVMILEKDTGKQLCSIDGKCLGQVVVVAGHITYVKDDSTYDYDIEKKQSRKVISQEFSQIPAYEESIMYLKGYDDEAGECVYYTYQPKENKLNRIGGSELIAEAVCGDTVYFYADSEGTAFRCGMMDKQGFIKGKFENIRWSEER